MLVYLRANIVIEAAKHTRIYTIESVSVVGRRRGKQTHTKYFYRASLNLLFSELLFIILTIVLSHIYRM